MADTSPQAAVNAQVSRLVAVNDALFTATADASADVRERVDQWHAQALVWISLGQVVIDHPERAGEWQRIGLNLGGDARDLEALAQSETLAGRIETFIAGMPGAFKTVTHLSVHYVAEIAKDAGHEAADITNDLFWDFLKSVPWPVWLVAGGVVLLGGYMLASGKAATLVKAAVP